MSFSSSSQQSSSKSDSASAETQASHSEQYDIVNTGLTQSAASDIKNYLTKYFKRATDEAKSQTDVGINRALAQQQLANVPLTALSDTQYDALDSLRDLIGIARPEQGSRAQAKQLEMAAKLKDFNAAQQGKQAYFGSNLNNDKLIGDLNKKIQQWQALKPIYGNAPDPQGSAGKGGQQQQSQSSGGKGGSNAPNEVSTTVPGPLGGNITSMSPQPTPAVEASSGKGGNNPGSPGQGPLVGYEIPTGDLGYFGEGGGIYQTSMTPQEAQRLAGYNNQGKGGASGGAMGAAGGKGGTEPYIDANYENYTAAPGQGNSLYPTYTTDGRLVYLPGITASANADIGDGMSQSASINSNPSGTSRLPDNQTVYPANKTFAMLSPSVINTMQDDLLRLQSAINDGNYSNISPVLLDKLFGKGYAQHWWEQGGASDQILADKFIKGTDAQGNTIYTAKDASTFANPDFKGARAVLTAVQDPTKPTGTQGYQISYTMDQPEVQFTNPDDTMQAALTALQNSPGYQFNLDQGLTAMNRKAAAQGMLRSGQQAKDLLKYGQDYATNAYQNKVQNLMGVLGITSPSVAQGSQQGTSTGQLIGQGYGDLSRIIPDLVTQLAGNYSDLDQAANQIFQRYLTGVSDSAGAAASRSHSESQSSGSSFGAGK